MDTCRCGCGTEVTPGRTWIRGHHWRALRAQQGITDSKECELCGRTYWRSDLADRQSNKHWAERQFCSEECRRRSITTTDPDAPTKRCQKCHRVLPKSEFWRLTKSRDGLQGKCKDCVRAGKKRVPAEVQRDRNLRQFYGITAAEYDAMHKAQGGVCAICRRPERLINWRNGGPYSLAVDHCHDSKKVRSLLCCACNQTLGKMDNDPDRLRAAAAYLEAHA